MRIFAALLTLLIGASALADGKARACYLAMGRGYQDYSQSAEHTIFGALAPKSVAELSEIVKTTERPIAVRGAGFSMGGQTASENGIVIDMRNMNKVIEYDTQAKTIRIQAGATWRQVQELIDKDDLSVMIMQSYNNFQIGGSLSVNAHGRYVGYGPLVSSVIEVKVMMADGTVKTASRTENKDLFEGVIGGYAALGVIVEAKLQLVNNAKLERRMQRFSNPDIAVAVKEAIQHFEREVEKDGKAVMFNADIYPRDYTTVDAITYRETDRQLTDSTRLQPTAPKGVWANLWHSAMVSLEQLTNTGKNHRVREVVKSELIRSKVVTRNNEASYSNDFLKPLADRVPMLKVFPFARRKALLQEYFIPRESLPQFIAKLKEIFLKYDVNVSNVSLRHVPENNESLLSWSKVDSFAVVVYYTQPYGSKRAEKLDNAKEWTREMIAEVEKLGGSFYLPYQIYATRDQFNHAYPNHEKFFALKQKYDPTTKFNNSLWDQYRLSEDTYHYLDLLTTPGGKQELTAYFTNIFSINDPARFLTAVEEAMKVTAEKGRDLNDRNIYDEMLKILPKHANGPIKKTVETLRALRVQQREMAEQTAAALGEVGVTKVDGYLEIGSPGRYVWPLRKLLDIKKKIYVMADSFSVNDWIETSFGFKIPAVALSKRIKFSNYDQIRQSEIPNESLDVVTMYIGLHHCPPEKLPAFVNSINRMLRVGGKFILRDHDADEKLLAMAFLAHSTYNAGLGLPYDAELNEVRNLQPLAYWKNLMTQAGFRSVGSDRKQRGDPTGNTLMVFEKIERTPEVEKNILDSIAAEGPGVNLNLLPGYHRAQSNTYMTQAEWFLVDIFKELSQFSRQSPWYEFPFEKFVAQYEDIYDTVQNFARREGLQDKKAFKQYDEMDKQLLAGMKMMFKAMKFAADRAAKQSGGQTDPEFLKGQQVLSDFFAQYAEFMTHTPWYMFPHRRTLADLRENFEQRTALTNKPVRSLLFQTRVLFSAMDFVAALTRWGLKENEVVPTTSFLLKVNEGLPLKLDTTEQVELERLTKDFVLARTGRYMPFTRVMKAAADSGAQVVQVAGNKYISVLIKAPEAQLSLSTPTDSIMTYQYPTANAAGGEKAHHHMVRARVSELPALLKETEARGLEVVRVHDY